MIEGIHSGDSIASATIRPVAHGSETITSTANPRVKAVVRLREQSAERRATGLFCIESRRELERAQAAGFEVVELYVCPELTGGDVPPDACIVTEGVLKKIALRENPEGLVAVLKARSSTWGDVPRETELFVVCSGLEKPGNIGAILRSADAAGAAVLIDSPGFDLFNPHCIRASTGAVFSVPVICDSREAIRKELMVRGIHVIAATPEAERYYTDQINLARPVAFVMGAEAAGLDAFWKEAANERVSIPQRGTVDSLNVSVTTALLLFEAVRQKGLRLGA